MFVPGSMATATGPGRVLIQITVVQTPRLRRIDHRKSVGEEIDRHDGVGQRIVGRGNGPNVIGGIVYFQSQRRDGLIDQAEEGNDPAARRGIDQNRLLRFRIDSNPLH